MTSLLRVLRGYSTPANRVFSSQAHSLMPYRARQVSVFVTIADPGHAYIGGRAGPLGIDGHEIND